MSDTVKLIIEIPTLDYECAKQRWMRGNDAHKMDYYISKGIPLDAVKAEIESGGFTDLEGDTYIYVPYAFEILDNISKAESEDKE